MVGSLLRLATPTIAPPPKVWPFPEFEPNGELPCWLLLLLLVEFDVPLPDANPVGLLLLNPESLPEKLPPPLGTPSPLVPPLSELDGKPLL